MRTNTPQSKPLKRNRIKSTFGPSLVAICLCLLLATGLAAGDGATSVPGPYLGQSPPGDTAELFAPGILPVEGVQHCFPAFTPDGGEVYWTTVIREGGPPHSTIWYMERTDGVWSEPQIAPFSGKYNDQNPCVSTDGNRMYFSSRRPDGFGRAKNIWYVERSDSGWSEAYNLGSPPNTDLGAMQMTFTTTGTAYFIGAMEGTQWQTGIYRSRLVDGKYLPPEPLPVSIVTSYADVYPFIAPDESYLLFGSTRPGGKSTETDLYISFRNDDDTWTEPMALDERINNGRTVLFACVTHDGRYLFFNRFDGDGTDKFYWIDAKVIEEYRTGTKGSLPVPGKKDGIE